MLFFVDMQVGQQVYVVSALDLDTAPGVTFDFAPGGNPDSVFSLDHFSGRITLARELDYEQRNAYIIRVIANDTAHMVTGHFYVNVTDENDNAPMFMETGYEVNSLLSLLSHLI